MVLPPSPTFTYPANTQRHPVELDLGSRRFRVVFIALRLFALVIGRIRVKVSRFLSLLSLATYGSTLLALF